MSERRQRILIILSRRLNETPRTKPLPPEAIAASLYAAHVEKRQGVRLQYLLTLSQALRLVKRDLRAMRKSGTVEYMPTLGWQLTRRGKLIAEIARWDPDCREGTKPFDAAYAAFDAGSAKVAKRIVLGERARRISQES